MNTEVEVKAKEMGWSPKEEFRGDPDRWIDAETFVKRGEELMPLLKATTKKQSEELRAVRGELKETRDMLAAATDAIEALKETTSQAALEKVREKRTELKKALVEARSDNDVDKELEIQEKIAETTNALKASETAAGTKTAAKAAAGDQPKDFTQTPEWKEWVGENPWFGPDKRKTSLALGIAQDLREKGETAQGKAFFNKVTEELNSMLGIRKDPQREAPAKVEGDARGSHGGGGNGSGKSYSDLPADAKTACENAASRVVGKGRAYADMAEWRKAYVQKYFEA